MVWLSVIHDSVAQSHFKFEEFLVYIPIAFLAGTLEDSHQPDASPVYMIPYILCCWEDLAGYSPRVHLV